MNPTPFQIPSLDELNALIPAFDFTAMLASNDFSAVFMARQRSLDRDVAIKLLSPQISGNPDFRQSFESTARTMGRLNHPNLIGVYDSGFVDGMLYFIMEFVPGKSLERSAKGQQVEVSQSIRLVEALCDALAHAHAHGIYHGELDPGDILLNQKAEPKIGNFGFSHPLANAAGDSPFSAPEIRSGAPANAKSDIYAVGALLYQLVTGHPHREGAAPPSSLSAGGAPLDAVCKRATEPDPSLRYEDMASFRKAVTELAKARPAGSTAPGRTPPISQRMTVAPPKTDSLRSAQAPRTVVQRPKKTNWKLALNVTINLILLGSLPFAWKFYKESRARKEREFNEQVAREKAERENAEKPTPAPSTTGSKLPNPADIPLPTGPKPAPPGETPLASLTRLKRSLAAGQRGEMPVGSVRQGDNDYFLITDPMTWPEASSFADQHGGHLAVPSAGADLTWLAAKVAEKRSIWVGAARNDRSTWALADGTPWNPKTEPAGFGSFLSLDKSGLLNLEPVKTKLPFIIQWHRDGSNPGSLRSLLEKTRSTLGQSSPVFPPGTVVSGNRHYLYVASPAAWPDAADLAEASGGHLMVTSDPAEIPAVSSMIDTISAPHGIWLGGIRKGDEWTWITGEPWKSAGWGKSRAAESDRSALVAFPLRGWDSRDQSEPASGFIIEWSEDHKVAPPKTSPKTTPKSPTGSTTETANLVNKAKDLIVAADAKRTEQLASNAKKLPWDLDLYLRSLAKGEQTIWAPHVERLKASVVKNRVPESIPQSSGIKLTEKMSEVAQSCADKQARIDADFLADAEKIRTAYLSRLHDAIATARKSGQTATEKSLNEALSSAADLEPWIRSLGVEPKPENPVLPDADRPKRDRPKGDRSKGDSRETPPDKTIGE